MCPIESLTVLDDFLLHFATTHHLNLSKDNAKGDYINGYEERSLSWQSGDLSLFIQIFPVCTAEKIKNWSIWIAATTEKADGRYWWRCTLLEGSKATIISGARKHITNGYRALQNLDIADLEKA